MINVIKKARNENTTFRPPTPRGDRRSSILHNPQQQQQQRSQSAGQQQPEQSTRFQSEERVESFQQFTSPALQPQQFAPRQPTVSIPPAPTYVAAFGPTYIFAANPAFSTAISAFALSGYAKEIANLAKLYTEEMKYEKKNDNFGHKLTFFHHFCSKADLPHEVRFKALSFMLKGFALDYYLANVNMLKNVTLDQTCTFISTHFENPDNRRNNLQK